MADVNKSEATPPKEPEQPLSNNNSAKSKKGRSRGKRGGPSAKLHDESFRTRAGASFVKNEIKTKISEKTYTDEFLLVEQLRSLAIDCEPLTCPVPVTTNGLAFMVNLGYNAMARELKRAPIISKNALYRLALAQFQLQYILAKIKAKGQLSAKLETQSLSAPFLNFDQLVMSHGATLKVLATVINAMGNFEYEGVEHQPRVLKSKCKMLVQTSVVDETEGSPAKRRTVETMLVGPDPYVVTFSNLRETVEALADRNTNEQFRRFFREHNTLPGALWDGNILVNPDEIMPANYGYDQLSDDFEDLESQLSNMRGKLSYLIGEINYDGKGSPAILTSCHLDRDLIETSGFRVSSRVEGTFKAPRLLSAQQMALGALTLLGTYPSYNSPDALSEYALRSPLVSGRVYPIDWLSMCSRCLSNT